MAASQVRLLQLTSRKNTIGRQLESLSLQKTSLTREMQGISKDYQNALSSKTLKWSTNSGASYVDLSYANLMRPGSANNNTPYLITDKSGKVVLDNKYKQYAEMISPNGAPGGDWEANRAEILSSLTGIPAEDIEASEAANAQLETSADKVNTLQAEVDKALEDCSKSTKDTDFMILFGDLPAQYDWDFTDPVNLGYSYEAGLQSESGSHHLGLNTQDPNAAKQLMDELFEILKGNAKNHLTDEDYEAFAKACDETKTEYHDFIDAFESGYYACGDDKSSVLNQYGVAVSKRTQGEGVNTDGKFFIRISNLVENLLRNYEAAGGSCKQNSVDSNIMYYSTVDRNSAEYQTYETKKAELDAAKAEYDEAVDTSNQTLTSEQESSIAFYDKIFSAIAENGWTANSQVSDNDYLNQMLQNNRYYITTVETATDDDGKEYFEYDTNSATNFDNIFQVNDSDAQEAALVEYEYQKSIINEKESRIDTRMQNLETEQSAINEMIKGIETVRNDNTERTFSIFS